MPRPSLAELDRRGRATRRQVGRRSHAACPPADHRDDPVAILAAQDVSRAPELLGLRYARMAASPFTFLRGSAAVMAADLVLTPTTSLTTQLCGDAHLDNFGTFASPEGRLVFDVNDFDETMRGSFEWDLKRMSASVVVAARDRGFDAELADDAVASCLTRYRAEMRGHRDADLLEVWHASIDEHTVLEALRDLVEHGELSAGLLTATEKVFTKARQRTSKHAAQQLTEVVDGQVQMREAPPVLSRDVLPDDRRELATRFLAGYVASLPAHQRGLLERFEVVDVARRVVGVGSVGTRCYVILLHGRDEEDPLVLQVKEAAPSVLEPHLAGPGPRPHGHRVVEGQRTMQTVSDIFLGWSTAVGPDGVERDYYVRQFRNMKGGIDLTDLDGDGFVAYARLCGHVLADAHARGGQPAELAGYLGSSDGFIEAMIGFAHAYADTTERDHQLLLDAIRTGRVPHEPGS
ncbi:MAG: DUF2252 domain-containing protein [Nitriliruptoraceae bacterium]